MAPTSHTGCHIQVRGAMSAAPPTTRAIMAEMSHALASATWLSATNQFAGLIASVIDWPDTSESTSGTIMIPMSAKTSAATAPVRDAMRPSTVRYARRRSP